MLTLLRSSRIQEARPKRPCLLGRLLKKLAVDHGLKTWLDGWMAWWLDREFDDCDSVIVEIDVAIQRLKFPCNWSGSALCASVAWPLAPTSLEVNAEHRSVFSKFTSDTSLTHCAEQLVGRCSPCLVRSGHTSFRLCTRVCPKTSADLNLHVLQHVVFKIELAGIVSTADLWLEVNHGSTGLSTYFFSSDRLVLGIFMILLSNIDTSKTSETLTSWVSESSQCLAI